MAFTYAGLINTQTWFDQFGKLLKNANLTITAHGSMTLWNLYGGASRAPVLTQPIATDAEGNFAHGDVYGDPGDVDVWRGTLYLGTFHIAPDVRDFAGGTGPPGPTLNPRGTYSGAATYAAFDQVNWSASGPQGSYYAKAAPPVGTDPSNTTYWAKIADPGAQGIQGIPGVAGPPGVNWRTDSLTILPSTAYALNDGLQDAGGSWRCILAYTSAATPVAPSLDTTHWAYVAQQGTTGSPGSPGATGQPGINWRSPLTIQASTLYNVNDGLNDAGGSWRCILAYTSAASPVAPSLDSTHWTYVAQQGSQGTPGPQLNPRGPWSNATAYAKYDAVTYLGSSYWATAIPPVGDLPTNTANWQLIAQAGAIGPSGSAYALQANYVLTANQAGLSGLPTVDGTTLTDGQVLLLIAQATGSQNGPWVVHAGAWTRPSWWAASTSQAAGTLIEVLSGAMFASTFWTMTNTAAITVDTTAETWAMVMQTISGTHANKPTAAAWNARSVYFETDTGLEYQSNGSVWTQITSGTQLAIAYLTTSPTTASGTMSDVAGLSITFIAPSRPFRLRTRLQFDLGVVNTVVSAQLTDSANTLVDNLFELFAAISGNSYYNRFMESQLPTGAYPITPGNTYTFKVRWATGTGTNTIQINAGANNPSFLVAEAA